MDKKTGGQAFPVTITEDDGENLIHRQHTGMSLRDYFAGQALMGFCVTKSKEAAPPKWNFNNVSIICYKAADAMITQRERWITIP